MLNGNDKADPAPRPTVEIAHATPGRVRLRVPAARRNPALLEQIKGAFAGHAGIDAVNVTPASCSVVIYYDPTEHPDPQSLFGSLVTTAAPVVPAARRTAESTPVAAALNGVSHTGEHRRGMHTKLDEELEAVEQEAEFLAEHSAIARSVVDAVKKLDREIKRSTNNNLDLKILTPLALAAVTFIEIGAAAATPMWVTLAIFSMNHFVELKAHDGGTNELKADPAQSGKPG